MDIENLIPENTNKWYVKHNTLYFTKYGAIPILKKIDGLFYVSLDLRVTKKVIKVIQYLTKLDITFYLCDRITISEKHIYSENKGDIIRNYLLALSDEVFFKFVQNSDFDYIRNITGFLNLYDCHTTFKNIYDTLKANHFEKVWMDWYTRKEYYAVKNEEIRYFYSILERQIKLNLFFD
jgi:hypothetical protein